MTIDDAWDAWRVIENILTGISPRFGGLFEDGWFFEVAKLGDKFAVMIAPSLEAGRKPSRLFSTNELSELLASWFEHGRDWTSA